MPHPELIDYIKKTRTAGESDEQIRRKLLEVGWESNQVNQAFSQFNTSQPHPTQTSSSTTTQQPTISQPSQKTKEKPKSKPKRPLHPKKSHKKLILSVIGAITLLLLSIFIVARIFSQPETVELNYLLQSFLV